MYLKEIWIKILGVKNFILNAVGWFLFCVSVYYLAALFVRYHDDLETIKHARSYDSSILYFEIAIAAIIFAYFSKKMIGNARLFSSFFELDLDGYISYSDLAGITGRSVAITKIEIAFYRIVYMKGFSINSKNKGCEINLDRKTVTCQCKSCGAIIEKSAYFVGHCSYCGSMDLHASVITGERFYSITTENTQGSGNPSYYCKKNIKKKTVANTIWLVTIASLVLINAIYAISHVAHYFDEKYIKSLLFTENRYFSVQLVKYEMLDAATFGFVFFFADSVVLYFLIKRMIGLVVAASFADLFAKHKQPFVGAKEITAKLRYKRPYKRADFSIKRGYLKNCTFEKHDNEIVMALAKKIVKDKCPSCNGPIGGAVTENYVCKYCNNTIMGVVKKK